MSTELTLFTFNDSQVRTIVLNGEPWWVSSDVCAVLGYSRVADALRMLDDDDLGTHLVRGPDRLERPTQIVSEPGLYSLILRSKRPEAKEFKRWVTHEVIPSIRKTGSYNAPARQLSRRDLAQMVIQEADRADAAEAKVAQLEPAAEAWQTLATARGDYSVADAAKILSRDPGIKLGRDRLFTVLRGLGWAFRQGIDGRHRAYQKAIDNGRLSELPSSHYHPRTGELVLDPPQVRVTVKGLEFLHQHLGGTTQLRLDLGGAA